MVSVRFAFVIASVFAVSALAAVSGASTAPDLGYRYVFSKQAVFARIPRSYSNVTVTITKGGYPLMNRDVRFSTTDTRIVRFKNGESDVVKTDDRGTARAAFTPVSSGTVTMLVEVLSPRGSEMSQRGSISVTAFSMRELLLRPALLYLFVITATAFLIAFFRRTRKGVERTTYSFVGMSTLFGLSMTVKRIHLIPILAAIECVIMFLLFLPQTSLLAGMFLALMALTAFVIPRDRGYSFFFMFGALIGMTFIFRDPTLGELFSYIHAPAFLSAWYFMPILFFIAVIFFSGNFFPYLILTLYVTLFTPDLIAIGVSLAMMYLADIAYVLKTKYRFDTRIFYRINFLKFEE
ncbi:MAG: hypothetical protein AABZ39_04695 [Spirochaetota bacterium]